MDHRAPARRSLPATEDELEQAMPSVAQVLQGGAVIVTALVGWEAISYPFASWLGKRMKKHGRMVDPYAVKDMRGGSIGMNFYIADLMHDAQKSRPEQGDAVIILDICGMGMTVAKDRRGNVTSEFSTPQEPAPGDTMNPRREFDTFDVHINGQGEEKFKRYQFRPCRLAPRTWVIVL